MDINSNKSPHFHTEEIPKGPEKRKGANTFPDNEVIAKKSKFSESEHSEIEQDGNPPSVKVRVVAHHSPKKRLEVPTTSNINQKTKTGEKFIYGNYRDYYNYRNKGSDYHDVRLDVFAKQPSLFSDKDVLDIGCNKGVITMEVAKRYSVKSIVGLDIDKALISRANKLLFRQKKALPWENEKRKQRAYPYNVRFVHGNYVLQNDVLLEIERMQFDVILCLSTTKWIHLNFGDAGLKQAFKRMFLQLRSGGRLILEAQPFDNYGRRKRMTESIFKNYNAIKFHPEKFTEYLLSSAVGFTNVQLMGVPDHSVTGFKRPIQIFQKP